MILMAVGDENTADLLLVLDQVADIGDDHINAVHIIIGETHTAVHYHDVAAVFIHRQVLADLIETAQRNNFQFFCHKISFIIQISQKTSMYDGKASTYVPKCAH